MECIMCILFRLFGVYCRCCVWHTILLYQCSMGILCLPGEISENISILMIFPVQNTEKRVIPTLSSLVTPEIVIMTTTSATNENKVCSMHTKFLPTVGFQWNGTGSLGHLLWSNFDYISRQNHMICEYTYTNMNSWIHICSLWTDPNHSFS